MLILPLHGKIEQCLAFPLLVVTLPLFEIGVDSVDVTMRHMQKKLSIIYKVCRMKFFIV